MSFEVEFDSRYVQKLARYTQSKKDQPISTSLRRATDISADMAKIIMPCEIICPPIAVDDIPKLERLVVELRALKGSGTSSGPLRAYGMHINPEPKSMDLDYIINVVRAFIVLKAAARPLSPAIFWAPTSSISPENYRIRNRALIS